MERLEEELPIKQKDILQEAKFLQQKYYMVQYNRKKLYNYVYRNEKK